MSSLHLGVFNKPLSTIRPCDSRSLYKPCPRRATRRIKFHENGIQAFYCDACAREACEFYTFPADATANETTNETTGGER
jgi:hypothetical protein